MAETPGAPAGSAEDELLLLACLFHGSFSVDWIQDLSGQRASAVLRAMAHGVNLGALEGETPDTFRVVDGTLREQVLARVPKESRDSWRRQIVDLVGTAAGDDGVLLEIAHQLMQLPGDIATWRRTLEVGLELSATSTNPRPRPTPNRPVSGVSIPTSRTCYGMGTSMPWTSAASTTSIPPRRLRPRKPASTYLPRAPWRAPSTDAGA